VKVCLEAKDRRQPYEVIARYIIDYGIYDAQAVKEIMREESVEGMLNKFMLNSPYRAILREALEEYKRTRSSADAIAAVDRLYYKMLGNVIIGLRAVDNSSARIVKMDIDLKNMLLLIKAKRVGAKFSEIANGVIAQGNMPVNELESIYSNSKDIEAMAAQFKQYDLKDALESYRSGKPGKLLSFEISLRNNVFMQSRRMLNHSMLSFGAMLAYAYMKEIEIFTLRIIINSRLYGLGREDTAKLINDSTRKPIISMVG
jgi:vacuolar-type H+-ATPase subunit C/Vma6